MFKEEENRVHSDKFEEIERLEYHIRDHERNIETSEYGLEKYRKHTESSSKSILGKLLSKIFSDGTREECIRRIDIENGNIKVNQRRIDEIRSKIRKLEREK